MRLHLGWALTGCALTSLVVVGLALRWRIFLRQQSISLPFRAVFSLTWAGQFFNSLLPGTTGGDLIKVYQICRLAPTRKAAAVSTIFVDRFIALLVLAVLALTVLVIDPRPLAFFSTQTFPTRIGRNWLLAIFAVLVTGAWLLFRFLHFSPWGGRLVRTFAAAKDTLSFRWSLLTAILLAFALHLVNFFIAYLFARALGISITYLQVLIIAPTVALFVMLPVTINGHGLRELLLIAYFTQMGITLSGRPDSGVQEIAIAWSLLLVTNDLLWSIPGGIWYMVRSKSNSIQPFDATVRN